MIPLSTGASITPNVWGGRSSTGWLELGTDRVVTEVPGLATVKAGFGTTTTTTGTTTVLSGSAILLKLDNLGFDRGHHGME